MLRSPVKFILLTAMLLGVWLLLSGIYIPRLVATGVVSSLIIAYVMDRAGLLDEESLPLSYLARGVIYWVWLAIEIVKSALNVTRIIINPSLPISPTMITFNPSQKTDVGRVTHANSITLTPGTITTGISSFSGTIQVHGIERDGAKGCVESDMDSKVSWFEGTQNSFYKGGV